MLQSNRVFMSSKWNQFEAIKEKLFLSSYLAINSGDSNLLLHTYSTTTSQHRSSSSKFSVAASSKSIGERWKLFPLSFHSFLSLSPNLKNERRRRRNCLQWVTKKEQLEKKRDCCEICTRCSSRININSLVFTRDFHKLMVIAVELILTYTVMTTDWDDSGNEDQRMEKPKITVKIWNHRSR